ncbi:MAG: ferric iron uptake transcriptional regulator [Gammaproteobacteria bacterium]
MNRAGKIASRDSPLTNAELKKAGLKTTLPRLRILAVLEAGKQRHMSAEDVYRALLEAGEDVGIATVYRVLTQFESAGLIRRHNFEEGHAVFELDSGEHHDHIVCVSCGKIVEFVDNAIEKRQEKIATAHGFTIQDHSLVLYGRCTSPSCARKT